MPVRYDAPARTSALDLPTGSMDFHVSHAVVEHVPPEDLSGIFREAGRLLREDGLFVHVIDLSDHFSHTDSTISTANFLQFSDRQWARWAGNRYMYMNRLRVDDLLAILEAADLEIADMVTKVDWGAEEAIRTGRLLVDDRFRTKPPDVNATTGVWVVARPRTVASGSRRPGSRES